jgi:hypothetical protein
LDRAAPLRFRGPLCIAVASISTSSSGLVEAAVAAARAGLGVVQAPDSLSFDAVMAGDLRSVLVEHTAPAPTFVLVYPSNRYLTARVRAFADLMKSLYPGDGWRPKMDIRHRPKKKTRRSGSDSPGGLRLGTYAVFPERSVRCRSRLAPRSPRASISRRSVLPTARSRHGGCANVPRLSCRRQPAWMSRAPQRRCSRPGHLGQ